MEPNMIYTVTFLFGGFLSVVAAIPVVRIMGFTRDGVRKSSLAAAWQKKIGNVKKHTTFNGLQALSRNGMKGEQVLQFFVLGGMCAVIMVVMCKVMAVLGVVAYHRIVKFIATLPKRMKK